MQCYPRVMRILATAALVPLVASVPAAAQEIREALPGGVFNNERMRMEAPAYVDPKEECRTSGPSEDGRVVLPQPGGVVLERDASGGVRVVDDTSRAPTPGAPIQIDCGT